MFVIARWDRTRSSNDKLSLKQLLIFPPLNYWNIFWVLLSILVAGQIFGLLIVESLEIFRPGFADKVQDNFVGYLFAMTDDWQSLILIIIGSYMAHGVGGFVAGKIPNKKCPSPYRHAIVGSIIFCLLNILVIVPLIVWTGHSDSPSEEDVSQIVLAFTPAFVFSILGVWLAIKTRVAPGTNKVYWSRRKLLLSACTLLVALIGIVVWVHHYNSTGPIDCPNPPTTAVLNFWPVSYTSPVEPCHDAPSVDAKLSSTGKYSGSQEEWERGMTAHAGDDIYVRIYINNGAAIEAEEVNPGRGIAHNVQLTTEIDQAPSAIHYIKVRFAGDNTNTVINSFKITTAPQERLEIIQKSGKIFDHLAKEIATDFDVGNNTITLGDLPPRWEDSIFIRFQLKVVT